MFLCILDDSELEKPESSQWEGLAPVISSKARRLSKTSSQDGPRLLSRATRRADRGAWLDWDSVLITRWGPVYERSPLTLGAWNWYTKPSQIAATLRIRDIPLFEDNLKPAVEF